MSKRIFNYNKRNKDDLTTFWLHYTADLQLTFYEHNEDKLDLSSQRRISKFHVENDKSYLFFSF